MNLEDLYYPAQLAELYLRTNSFQRAGFLENEDQLLIVPESYLVELFLAMGAVTEGSAQKMNKNESVEVQVSDVGSKSIVNQDINMGSPQVLLEEWRMSEENLIRCIMKFKNLGLKTVAERYGGKSAAANIANFLAKSDEELATMRSSTMRRLAEALGCPLEWLLLLKQEK